MNLDEFTRKALREVAAFHDYWMTRSEQSPAMYPAQLEEGDWWEQLQFYGSFAPGTIPEGEQP